MSASREIGFGSKTRAGYIHPAPNAASAQLASRPVKRPCGTIWPNGEFGLGYAPNREESDPFRPNQAGGVSLARQREECERIAEGSGALDLTSLPNSHKASNRPETYGRKGLSGYGGKFVRNAGHVLQDRFGKRRLTFLTVTLPPMCPEAAVAVASSWGETVRQLLQWLTRQLERQGLPKAVCSVTELQTQRLESGDSACLHLHVVFVGRLAGGAWKITPKMVRAWWLKRLSTVTGGEVESLNCVDMKAVKRDAGNYLSKYMSKGAGSIERYAESVGWDAVPRQWWNVSKTMRDAVKRRCLRGESIMLVLDAMVYSHYTEDDYDAFKFVRAIEVKATEYQSFVVGFWGKLTQDSVADLVGLTDALKSD